MTATPLAPVEVIERARRGEPVDRDSLDAFVRSWLNRVAGDEQMASWCMAVSREVARVEEVDAVARALVASGSRLELRSLGPVVDLQETGAVGDCSGLVALPLAACLGAMVATMGGRGIGHLGGVLDKLEAIPGLTTAMAADRMVAQLRTVGIAVVAPSEQLVSGAARFDALRDTAAVGGGVLPVVAPLLARALAMGAPTLAVAIPAGPGAAITDVDEARRVVAVIRAITDPWERRVEATIWRAAAPAGQWVGNAVEVAAAAEVLRGEGVGPVRRLAVARAAAAAEAAGVCGVGEGLDAAARALDDGRALAVAERWVEAQGGDPAVWTTDGALPQATVHRELLSDRAGWVSAVDAPAVGRAARWVGAGRLHAVQVIEPAAGIEVLLRPGDPVESGQPVLRVHACDGWLADRAVDTLAGAIAVADLPVDADDRLEVVDSA